MNHRKARGILVVLLAGAVSAPWAAAAKLWGSTSPDVVFTAIGPAGLKITGNGKDLKVVDDGTTVKVTVPLAGIKTGIALRDRHMHEKYLETSKYPAAELEVPRASLKVPAAGQTSTFDAAGTLRLHGKTAHTQFHCTSTRAGSKIRVTANLRLNMQEFGIEVPSYLGVTVKPDVDVAVQFETNEE
jgi:polyisoprenoid-binding protein YceI